MRTIQLRILDVIILMEPLFVCQLQVSDERAHFSVAVLTMMKSHYMFSFELKSHELTESFASALCRSRG